MIVDLCLRLRCDFVCYVYNLILWYSLPFLLLPVEAALQQQRAQQLALRQRRKQLDHDFKMRRELRHQRILQLQQQQQQQQQSQQQPYAMPASHLLQRQSSGSGSRLAMPMGSSLVRASSMQSISVPVGAFFAFDHHIYLRPRIDSVHYSV